MQSVFLITAIMGLIEFIKALNSNDIPTVEIIIGAVLVGGITGFFGVDHLTVSTGIQYGLSAAGTYKAAKLIGGNS